MKPMGIITCIIFILCAFGLIREINIMISWELSVFAS
mgnify:CR=1 FL=1